MTREKAYEMYYTAGIDTLDTSCLLSDLLEIS